MRYGVEIIHEGSTGTGHYPYYWHNSACDRYYTDDNGRRVRCTSYQEAQKFIENKEGVKLAQDGEYLVPVQPKPVIATDNEIKDCHDLIARFSWQYALRVGSKPVRQSLASVRALEERHFLYIIANIVQEGNYALSHGKSELEALSIAKNIIHARARDFHKLNDASHADNRHSFGRYTKKDLLNYETGDTVYSFFTALFPL